MVGMKIEFAPHELKEKVGNAGYIPWIGEYAKGIGHDTYVLVTGETEKSYEGYMINDNSIYQPFEYYTKEWAKTLSGSNKPAMIRFCGKVTIEV